MLEQYSPPRLEMVGLCTSRNCEQAILNGNYNSNGEFKCQRRGGDLSVL